ncbi:hypothetical protein TNCV_2572791 [Trichonephila clavipes]|nr:hypothetical protein TNCV_2572791 [Trichonephila clavipes]
MGMVPLRDSLRENSPDAPRIAEAVIKRNLVISTAFIHGHENNNRTGYVGGCKELLPAAGNRSNKRRDREEDLATTGRKRSERERRERVSKKTGVVKSRHG